MSLHVLNTILGNKERSLFALRSKEVIGETHIININVSYPKSSNSCFFFNKGREAAPVPSIIISLRFSNALAYFSLVAF